MIALDEGACEKYIFLKEMIHFSVEIFRICMKIFVPAEVPIDSAPTGVKDENLDQKIFSLKKTTAPLLAKRTHNCNCRSIQFDCLVNNTMRNKQNGKWNCWKFSEIFCQPICIPQQLGAFLTII